MYTKALKLLLLILVIKVAVTPWEISTILNLCTNGLFIISCFLPILAIPEKKRIRVKSDAVYFTIMCLALCISFVTSFTLINLNILFFRNVLMFVSMYWAILISKQTLSEIDLKHIFFLGKILSMVFIVYSFLPFPFRYTRLDSWREIEFTLNMGNPNGTSINVFFCLAFLVIEMSYLKKLREKMVNFLMIAALVAVIVMLGSRTILLCSVFVISMIWLKNIKFQRWHVNMILLVPLVFIFIQSFITEYLSDVVLFGKTLASGRATLYQTYTQEIMRNPLYYIFGKIGEHQLGNYHNALFSIFMNLGIIGAISYFLFWKFTIYQCINDKAITRVQMVAVAVVLAYIIHSSSESAPMIGMLGYGTPVIVMVRLAKDEINDLKSVKKVNKHFLLKR